MPQPDESPGLVQNYEERNRDSSCSSDTQRTICRICFFLASLTALALSIFAIVLAKREDTRLDENNINLIRLKQDIKTCYNDSYEHIQELAKQIDQIDETLTRAMADAKTTLQNKITSIETDLNTDFVSLQNQVTDMNTTVNTLQTSLGKFQDSTNTEFLKVWAKFAAIEKEIANLPKNGGSTALYFWGNNVVFYKIIALTSVWVTIRL